MLKYKTYLIIKIKSHIKIAIFYKKNKFNDF